MRSSSSHASTRNGPRLSSLSLSNSTWSRNQPPYTIRPTTASNATSNIFPSLIDRSANSIRYAPADSCSLTEFGALHFYGSLSFHGALLDPDSLPYSGALDFVGSFLRCGALKSCGSLRYTGALVRSGYNLARASSRCVAARASRLAADRTLRRNRRPVWREQTYTPDVQYAGSYPSGTTEPTYW